MFGSMFELCNMGELPLTLPNGETRTFLEDGDEVSFSARCERAGFAPLGFGSCAGRIVSALPLSQRCRATVDALRPLLRDREAINESLEPPLKNPGSDDEPSLAG